MPPDDLYKSAPAQWLTDAVTRNTGYTVEVNPRLAGTVAVDRNRGCIEIVSGLSFSRFHISLGRAALFAVFDETVVPEFRAENELPNGVIRLRSTLRAADRARLLLTS